jgi:hypothetical protein
MLLSQIQWYSVIGSCLVIRLSVTKRCLKKAQWLRFTEGKMFQQELIGAGWVNKRVKKMLTSEMVDWV